MEKKYYFRGLGLGIIVTALIMGIALSRGTKREMTDAEVIARAKELGMTENTRLLEPSETDEDKEGAKAPEPQETAKEPVKKDVSVAQPKDDAQKTEKNVIEEKQETGPSEEAPERAESDSQKKEAAQNKKPAADTNEMTKQDKDTGQKEASAEASSGEESPQQAASAASITIVSGDGSYTVAKKLEEAGVVSSASAYDDFLCQNGYDKRLRTGTFRIPAGASEEQIARIVSGQP